jgi:2-haloacid dehalogenase
VLALCLRRIGERFGVPVREAHATGFGESVGLSPAFTESAAALRRLQSRFTLAVITNCDDDLFARFPKRGSGSSSTT